MDLNLGSIIQYMSNAAKIPIIKIAELGPLAQKIIDRVGW